MQPCSKNYPMNKLFFHLVLALKLLINKINAAAAIKINLLDAKQKKRYFE